MSENEDTFSIVSCSEAFGDGVHHIYKGDDRMLTLDSHQAADGFEASLRLMSSDYATITIDEDSDNGALAEWGQNISTESLSDMLENARECDLKIIKHAFNLSSRAVAPKVRYFGFDPSMMSFLSEQKFADLLEKNGFVLTGERAKQLDYSQVDTSQIWVYDPNSKTGMAILHEGLVESEVVSKGFEQILQLMDSWLQENYDKRLILGEDEAGRFEEIDSNHRKYTWKYDYEMTRYVEN